jgi:hypothetical protein
MLIYLDESGDTGFKFVQGSTTHFIIALLLVADQQPLHEAVAELKETLRLADAREFKFAKTPHANRVTFFRTIEPLDFTVRALILDKRRISSPDLHRQETFYHRLVSSLLARNADVIPGSTLLIDESAQSKRAQEDFRSYLRKALRTTRDQPKFRHIHYRRSHSDHLLQVSDMICGALNAAYGKARPEPQYRDLLKRHLADEWFWDGG